MTNFLYFYGVIHHEEEGHMNDPNNFGTNLNVLRQERQMTMTEFSNHLQIPKSTLQSVMYNGQTSLDTACRISDALNIPC